MATWKTYKTSVVCISIFFVVGQEAGAWEDDLHYGLTKWLAIEGGFTSDAAETVGRGNQNIDVGAFSAIHGVSLYACLFPDANGSRAVRDMHFPTDVDVPNPPDLRYVKPNSAPARKKADQEAKVRIPAPYSDRQIASLRSLGAALHPLQDSWSHKGVPSVPLAIGDYSTICNSGYAWAHPLAAGGWLSHFPDLTPLHQDDAVAAARATYDFLVAYGKNNGWAVEKQKKPKRWSDLEHEVASFARAGTKAQKQRWFSSQKIEPTHFLNGINLPDGDNRFAIASAASMSLNDKAKRAVGDSPPQVRSFLTEVFIEWMVRRDYKRLRSNYFDPDKRSIFAASKLSETAIQAAFVSWQLRDHGLAAQFDHGLSAEGARVTAMLEMTKSSDSLVGYSTIAEALVPFDKMPEERFLTLPINEGVYAAFGRFRHTPRDIVVLIAELRAGNPRLVDLRWVVDQ